MAKPKRKPAKHKMQVKNKRKRVAAACTSHKTKETRFKDIEQAIAIAELQETKSYVPKKAMTILRLIHNTTPAMKKHVYNKGFSFGRNLYALSDKSMNPLFKVLEDADLGKVLYCPTDKHALFTSKQAQLDPTECAMHTYESGIIAGYMSAATQQSLHVRETHCIGKGDAACRFRLSDEPEPVDGSKVISMRDMGQAIMNCRNAGTASKSYCASLLLPITEANISEQASKLVYAAAKKSATSYSGKKLKLLNEISSSLGIGSAKVMKEYRKRPTLMRLKYDSYIPSSDFVELSCAAISGVASALYDASPQVIKKASGNNSYVVDLLLKHKSSD